MTRDRSGASAVEFAIVSLVLFVVLFGIVFSGLFLGTSHSVQQLASDTVRHSLAGVTARERRDLAQRYFDEGRQSYFLLGARRISSVIVENGDEIRIDIECDMADLPIWFPITTAIVPDKMIRRSVSTYVGRLL